MNDEPLDRRILREIRARLKESRAAVDEYERLQAALSALDAGEASAPARGRARRASTPARQRAARGANRDKALAVIADRPGITIAELASASGIAKNVLYSLTRVLTHRGEVERVQLPGESFGFRLAQSAESSTGAGSDSDGATSEPAGTPQRTRRARKRPAPTPDADGGSAADSTLETAAAPTEPAAA